MPLIEREGPLRTLASIADAAARGEGGVALVCGEAGIGKTTLLREFAARHRALGPVWWGLCDPLQTPQPLGPLLGLEPALRARWMPLLETSRAALFAGIVDTLRESPRPVLFVFEDAHWADDATLDLLRFIGRRVQDLPVVLAITFRDDEIDARHPLRRMIGSLSPGRCTRIGLPRLTADGVAALARAHGQPAASVHATSGGNPFFASELLRSAEPGVPASVQDLVLARHAELPPGAARLADLVAVVPGRTERWLADKLLAPAPDDIDAALRSGLLQADDANWHFRHELARQAVEDALAPHRAQALHAEVLAALDAHTAQPGVTAARCVHHAVRARDRPAVARFAPVAAQEAGARGAYRESVAQWATALQDGEQPDDAMLMAWLWQYALHCGHVDRLAEARSTVQRLAAMAKVRGEPNWEGYYTTFEAIVSMREVDLANALALSERALQLLEATLAAVPTREHCRACHVHAVILLASHRIAEAMPWTRRCEEFAQRLGTAEELHLAQRTLALARLFTDYEGGRDQLAAEFAEVRQREDKFDACLTALNLGEVALEFARWPDSAHWVRQAMALTDAHDWDHFIIYGQAWLAHCLVHLAQWAEAARILDGLMARGGLTPITRVLALLALCRLRLRLGDPGVDELLAELEPLVACCGTLGRLGMWAGVRAEVAAQRGDADMLREAVAVALPLAVQRGHACVVDELRCHALALEGDGRFEVAGDVDWRSVGADGGIVIAPGTPYALEAEGRWEAAAEGWRERGAPFEEARALSRGDAAAQRRALAIFDSLGTRPAADALRRRLRDAGERDLPRHARAAGRNLPCGLTAAEFEVLGQLAAGLRNAEIAERLHRSVRTVDHHVAAVLMKLGVESRHQAAARAVREGWLPEYTA